MIDGRGDAHPSWVDTRHTVSSETPRVERHFRANRTEKQTQREPLGKPLMQLGVVEARLSQRVPVKPLGHEHALPINTPPLMHTNTA